MTSLLFTEASGVWTQLNRSTDADLTQCLKISALTFSQNSHVHLNICSDFGEFTKAPVKYKILHFDQNTNIVYTEKFCSRYFWLFLFSVMQLTLLTSQLQTLFLKHSDITLIALHVVRRHMNMAKIKNKK